MKAVGNILAAYNLGLAAVAVAWIVTSGSIFLPVVLYLFFSRSGLGD